jgi:hypothetical protein
LAQQLLHSLLLVDAFEASVGLHILLNLQRLSLGLLAKEAILQLGNREEGGIVGAFFVREELGLLGIVD